MICYCNGIYVPKNEFQFPIEDLGFTRGYSVYELLRTYGDHPFHLDAHLERFKLSCETLKLPYPTEIHAIIDTLIDQNGPDLVFRIYRTGGINDVPALYVLTDPASSLPPPDPINIITYPHSRPIAQIKTTNYLDAMVAIKKAQEQNCQEALYISPKGEILELTKANFFAFLGDVLCTPKTDILEGITRKVVLQLAKQLGIPTYIGPIFQDQIPSLTGAFLSSTLKGLIPIAKIDNHKVPTSPQVARFINAFAKATQEALVSCS